MFAQHLIVDKDISFDQAIKKSWYLTKGLEWNLVAFIFAMFIIIVLGFLSLFVGLIIAIPVAQLSTSCLYLVILDKLDTDVINLDIDS